MIPAVLMMALIFFFSSRESEDSMESSMLIAYYVVDAGNNFGLIDVKTPEEREFLVSIVDGIVRKAAHMTEFGILSFTVWFDLLFWTDSRKKLYLLAVFISLFYAGTDEIHQLFVRGRNGCFADVLVDLSGISIVMLCTFFIESTIQDSLYVQNYRK